MDDDAPVTEPRPKRAGRVVAIGVVVAVVAAGLAIGLTRNDESTPTLVSGGVELTGTAALPKIAGTGLDGAKLDLAAYSGKPFIVNVWASWCLPCREEAPAFVAFAKAHPEIPIVGVNFNERRPADGIGFNREAGWTHPSFADPNGDITIRTLKIVNLPVTLYVDAKGIVRGRTLGPVTSAGLEDVAARL